MNEFFVPNTNELKLQRIGRLVARYDSFNSREMIFRIVVEGAISILSPKVFSSDSHLTDTRYNIACTRSLEN